MNLCMVIHKYGVRLDDPCAFPLGVGYIVAMLKQLGHSVKVLNYNLWDYDFAYEVKGQDAVLFTGFEAFMPHIIRDAAICREMGIQTVLGGALATFKPVEMLRHVDTVVIGEGETVIETALNSFGIVQGARPDLAKLPLPDYEALGIREYHRRNGVKHIGVLTSRGCPYSCKFCSHTCRFQMRDLGHVFEEIDRYRASYAPDVLVFNDNTLNLNKRRFMAICAEMKGRGLRWSAAIRVDVFDEEMASAFKSSGGEYFVVGVESFKQEKLDTMNKRITPQQITGTLDLLHKYGIGYHGNVLFGFPGETQEMIIEELETMPQGYNVFPVLVQPFIGTSHGERTLPAEDAAFINEAFRQYAGAGGMNCYPTA